MVFGRLLFAMVVACLVLPVAMVVVLAVARVLRAMQDQAGAEALDRIALAGGILWAVLLICLVLAQGIKSLRAPDDGPDGPGN